MNIDYLRSFVLVVQLGKISLAAEARYMVASAVSRQIRYLEKELGRSLFLRKNNRLQLTPFGQRSYTLADRILQSVNELETLHQYSEHRLSIGASMSAVPSYLPAVVAAFRNMHPEIDVTIQIGHNQDVLDLLIQGEIDLGVVSAPLENSFIKRHILFPDPLLLICSPTETSVPITETNVEIGQLTGKSVIAFPRGTQLRNTVDAMFQENNVHPNILMEVDSFEVVKRMVEAGLGMAVIPRSACIDELAVGRLRAIYIQQSTGDGEKLLTGSRMMCLLRLLGETTRSMCLWTEVCVEVAVDFQ